MIHNLSILASSGAKGADLFWDTLPGKIISALFGAAGVLVVLVTAVKGFTAVSQGKPGQAFKSIFGAIFLCVFLFNPPIMNRVINTTSDIFQSLIGDVENIKQCTTDAGPNGEVCNTPSDVTAPPAT